MSDSFSSFGSLGQLKDNIAESLRRLVVTLETLDRHDAALRPRGELAQLDAGPFSVLAVGQMQRGKSTLLNALLGQELLPTGDGTACTAIPISIRWNESLNGMAYRRGGSDGEGFEPTANEIKSRSRVRHDPAATESSFERVDISGPFSLCANGVTLHDSPGLDENDERTEITWKLAEKADAAIFVLSCGQAITQPESIHLKSLLDRAVSPRSVFVVWSHFDRPRRNDPEAVKNLRAVSDQKVKALGVPSGNIFFLSARESIDARAASDQRGVRESGLCDFEERLADFLIRDRASSKLSNAIAAAVWALEVAGQSVATRSVDDWGSPDRKTHEMAIRTRDKAERVRHLHEHLKSIGNKAIAAAKLKASAEAEALTLCLCDELPSIIGAAEVSFGDAVFQGVETKERLANQCAAWIDETSKTWVRDVLTPLVSLNAHALEDDVEHDLSEARSIGDDIKKACDYFRKHGFLETDPRNPEKRSATGTDRRDSSTQLVEFDVSGDWSADYSNGLFGGSLFGSGIAAVLMSAVAAPFVIPLAVGGAVIGALLGGSGAAARLKAAVARVVRDCIERQKKDVAARAAAFIQTRLEAAIATLEQENASLFAEISQNSKAIAKAQASLEVLRKSRQDALSAARSEIEQIAFSLSEAESAINPGIDPDDLAERIAERLSAIRQLDPPAEPDMGKSSMEVELKLKVGESALLRLRRCGDYLRGQGIWSARKQQDLADWWIRMSMKLEASATAQITVLRAVIAIALAEDEPAPPEPKVLQSRIKGDPGYLTRLSTLLGLLTDDPNAAFFNATPADVYAGLKKLNVAYGRGYELLIKEPDPNLPGDGSVRTREDL